MSAEHDAARVCECDRLPDTPRCSPELASERGCTPSAAQDRFSVYRASPRYPYTVRWEEDPSRTMKVTALCRRCEKAMTPWDLANEPQGVISPNGLEHHIDHDGTLCGMNATGLDWWWPC